MARLLIHRLDPSARLARLMLGEYEVAFDLQDISPWKRDPAFLELNPAATVPVFVTDEEVPVVGTLAVVHHVEEHFNPGEPGRGLFPSNPAVRAEMWRLVEWVLFKLNDEVTRYVIEEKIAKRELRSATTDPGVLRVAKANLAEHMNYFGWLLATRRWLGGELMSLADFALAAHLSSLDYLGDVDWSKHEEVKLWYARMKSRPAFRPLLSDRIVGMPAAPTYADLDF
ncbi:MAG TPA: glutathione S-transferase family protein [Devosiaceae bacterium]